MEWKDVSDVRHAAKSLQRVVVNVKLTLMSSKSSAFKKHVYSRESEKLDNIQTVLDEVIERIESD